MSRSRGFSSGWAGLLLCIVGAAVGCSSKPAAGEGQPADKSTAPVANIAEPVPAAAPSVTDPGGAVEVAATKSGLSRIGAEKCKMCHKVQFDSWSGGAHAKRLPALDCESCHGAGSEYKTLVVMKDPVQAQAAGLVMPEAGFCSTCHTAGVNDELRQRVHAHKR